MWPTFVSWGFDRVLRLCRYLFTNFFLRPKHSKGTLSLITPDSLRLTLTRRLPLGWRPGQHAFLSFPTISSVPLESHPFTIASIFSEDARYAEQELVFIIRKREGLTQKLVERAGTKNRVQVPVLVDGPYGTPVDLHPYRTCILIAGTCGIFRF